jgi:putative copper export protein
MWEIRKRGGHRAQYPPGMFWTVMIFLHVVAMAFFLGGQIMLASTIVPVLLRTEPADPDKMRAVAQRFGVGSLIALGVLLLTGMGMASHFELWDYGPFQVKMTLVIATIIAVLLHTVRGQNHVLMGITFLLTLATVYAGVNLTH